MEQEDILHSEQKRRIIMQLRHRKELRLYRWLIVFGALGVLILLRRPPSVPSLESLTAAYQGRSDIAMLLWTVYFVLSLFSGISAVFMLLITTLVRLYRYYAGLLSYSIRVSEKNFPEIYAKVQEYTALLGLKKEPEVYVRQMNGQVNAWACWIPGKTFIQLNAEIVDLAYMENRDFDTVFFIMAHEFGHICLHHVQLQYVFWPSLGNFFPVIGPLLSYAWQRAREYSADRVAQVLTDDQTSVPAMMMLSAGRHAYKYMDAEDYLSHITARQGPLVRFFRWCVNFFSTHPIFPYRVAAILDPQKRSGRLV